MRGPGGTRYSSGAGGRRDANLGDQVEISLHGMPVDAQRLVPFVGEKVIPLVGNSRRAREPDLSPPPAQSHQESALENPVVVDDPFILTAPQVPEEFRHLPQNRADRSSPEQKPLPPLAPADDHPVQRRVADENRAGILFHDPVDRGAGILGPQSLRHGQRLNDIPDGAELDDQDGPGRQIPLGAHSLSG